jgi:CO/xanthine dehydrogenase Mo-binding subunit
VQITHAPAEANLDFSAAKSRAFAPQRANREPTDHQRGDLVAGMAAAAATVGVVYTTPIEHHNPMEPHATVAWWNGDRLTLHDATQNVGGVRTTLAKVFGIAPENVTVIDPFVGGGFGCKGSAWSHVALAALAARTVGRPVKLVLERTQMFGPVGNRPRTEQTLGLGADRSGRLTAVAHQTISETSMLEDWPETSSLPARHLYASASTLSTHRITKLHIATPTFTRAPGEASGNFALECAMDELRSFSRSIHSSCACATTPSRIRARAARTRASRCASAIASAPSASAGSGARRCRGRCATAAGASVSAWRPPPTPPTAAPPRRWCGSFPMAASSSARRRTTSAPAPTP